MMLCVRLKADRAFIGCELLGGFSDGDFQLADTTCL